MMRRINAGFVKKLMTGLVALTIMCPGLLLGADKGAGQPAEADLYLHIKDALKNPRDDQGLPRVLLIGDSISIGYTIPVRLQLKGKASVYRPPTNCQHTGVGLASLKSWLGTNHWDVIHFNWGIWDTHMLDAKGQLVLTEGQRTDLHIRYTLDQYKTNLTKLVEMLEGTGAKLVWASTTPIMSRTGPRFNDISDRNEVAAAIMKAHKIPIDDLYAFSLPNAGKWLTSDKVHFNAEGVKKLGEQVSASILDALNSGKP